MANISSINGNPIVPSDGSVGTAQVASGYNLMTDDEKSKLGGVPAQVDYLSRYHQHSSPFGLSLFDGESFVYNGSSTPVSVGERASYYADWFDQITAGSGTRAVVARLSDIENYPTVATNESFDVCLYVEVADESVSETLSVRLSTSNSWGGGSVAQATVSVQKSGVYSATLVERLGKSQLGKYRYLIVEHAGGNALNVSKVALLREATLGNFLPDGSIGSRQIADGSIGDDKLEQSGGILSLVSNFYKYTKNLVYGKFPYELPYNVVHEGTENGWWVLPSVSSVSINAGYYVFIVGMRYESDDTALPHSGVFAKITDQNYAEIGTVIATQEAIKISAGSSLRYVYSVKKIDTDYSQAVGRLVLQGRNGGDKTSKITSITLESIAFLRFDTEGDALSFVEPYRDNLDPTTPPVGDLYGRLHDAHIEKIDRSIAAMQSEIPTYDHDILFWGDSLTAGAGGGVTTYPSVCANLLGVSYKNCGVGGETANTIAARQGGNNIIIPAGPVNGTYELNDLADLFGYHVNPLRQGNGSNSGNMLYVNGSACTLSITQSSATATDATYTITGYSGDELPVPQLGTFVGADFTGKVVVIWVGQNGAYVEGATGIDARMAIIDSMIEHVGHKRCIILGLSTGTESSRASEDNAMLLHYGNRFFPTRRLLVENGLTVAGITPTEQDETDIAAGTVPTSLRSDGVHLNASGYKALGTMLADKIRSLRYLD